MTSALNQVTNGVRNYFSSVEERNLRQAAKVAIIAVAALTASIALLQIQAFAAATLTGAKVLKFAFSAVILLEALRVESNLFEIVQKPLTELKTRWSEPRFTKQVIKNTLVLMPAYKFAKKHIQ